MTKFFTSDNHFFHRNIAVFCPDSRAQWLTKRWDRHKQAEVPTTDVDRMTEAMIERHNSVVKDGDEVFFLGDFSFGDFVQTSSVLARLKGQKFLIYGNHDQIIKKNKSIQSMFVWCRDYFELTVDGTKVCMFHFPQLEWNKAHGGAFHLHGHVHGGMDHDDMHQTFRMMDVGVDTRPSHLAGVPYTFDEIKQRLGSRQVLKHHDRVMRQGE